MRDEQQIKEMARDICLVQPSCNDVFNPAECCTAWKYANRAYDAGYRKQEWISVEDRLPEANIYCLVFLPEGHLYTGIHVAYYSDKRNMWVDLDATYLFDHPTHWMPLPTPPTEKEN